MRGFALGSMSVVMSMHHWDQHNLASMSLSNQVQAPRDQVGTKCDMQQSDTFLCIMFGRLDLKWCNSGFNNDIA